MVPLRLCFSLYYLKFSYFLTTCSGLTPILLWYLLILLSYKQSTLASIGLLGDSISGGRLVVSSGVDKADS